MSDNVFDKNGWAVTRPESHPTIALEARHEEIGVSIARLHSGRWEAQLTAPMIGAGDTPSEALERLSYLCARFAAGMRLLSLWAVEEG